MTIDVGKLTQEETVELLKACINALTSEQLFEALNDSLSTQDKEELGESWFNIDREGV